MADQRYVEIARVFLLLCLSLCLPGCDSSATSTDFTIPPGGSPGIDVSVAPSRGPSSGGNTILLIGPGASLVDRLSIGGVSVSEFEKPNASTLTFLSPPHEPGLVDIEVASGDLTVTLEDAYTFLAAPTLTSLVPNEVPLEGASGLVLTGTGFVDDSTVVTVDGVDYTATSITPNSLTFNAPAHSEGNVAVSVTTPGGTSDNVAGGLTYTSGPIANAVTPNQSPLSGTVGVVLSGSGFQAGATTVQLGDSEIVPSQVSASSLTFDAPADTAGTLAVTVTTPFGTSRPVPGGFTYTPGPTANSLSPDAGPLSGTASVSLSGTGFTALGGTTVIFDGQPIEPSNVTATSLTFAAPPHAAGTVQVTVSTAFGVSGNLPGGFTYFAAPTVSTLTPNIGPLSGTAGVVLQGTNFVPGRTEVRLDNSVVITPSSVTSTSLVFDAPASEAGPISVSVFTPGGSSGDVEYTYTESPTAITLIPSAGPLAGYDDVELVGSGFVEGQTTVTIDGDVREASVLSSTRLTFDAPAHAAGTVTVSVSTPGGTSQNVAGGFTYTTGPTVTALQPNAGPLAGTSGVVLTGGNFVAGATTVTVDNIVVTPTAVTAGSLTFDAPAHIAGTVAVAVTTPGGVSDPVPGGFTYMATPTIASITPNSGPMAGGQSVNMIGAGFVDGLTVVSVDGVEITPSNVTTTTLTFLTPAHASGSVAVTVTTPGGTSGPVPGGYFYVPPPTITQVSPATGFSSGGTVVTITGTGLLGTSEVSFGTVAGTNLTVVDNTTIQVTTPVQAAGIVDVSVTTSNGMATSTNAFTYTQAPAVTSISPNRGLPAGNTPVTLVGTFPGGITGVTFGGISATNVTMVDAETYTMDTPAHPDGLVDVVVTLPADSITVTNGFNYVGAPTITLLSPDGSEEGTGRNVIVTGTNFLPGETSVELDGVSIGLGSVHPSLTSLFDFFPGRSASTVSVTVTTPLGTSNALPFTYAPLPFISSITPNQGPPAGGTMVTLTGTDFYGQVTLLFGGQSASNITVVNSTTITAITPAGTAGATSVQLNTSSGGVVLGSSFTYVNP